MNEQKPSIADRIETDIQNALEARLLEYEGHTELADQLRRVVEGLRGLTPKVVANGQGGLR